jgi:hypothetical protein
MDRFDLEQAIFDADMTNDLKTAFERHCDGSVMSQDEVDNMLMALWQMSALRQWKLWDVFCRVFELDEYSKNPEVQALRERYDQVRKDSPVFVKEDMKPGSWKEYVE